MKKLNFYFKRENSSANKVANSLRYKLSKSGFSATVTLKIDAPPPILLILLFLL